MPRANPGINLVFTMNSARDEDPVTSSSWAFGVCTDSLTYGQSSIRQDLFRTNGLSYRKILSELSDLHRDE